MRDVTDKIIKRIHAKKRGWVFTPKDFSDLGVRTAVDQTLSRLSRKGMIRRLDRGVYDYPRQHATLGKLSPDTDRLAQALTSRFGDKAFPSGAMAANILGLSTQVPARPVYLTNGPSRTRQIAGRTITFKHARVPLMDRLSIQVNFTLQALAWLGKDSIDDKIIQQCASNLDNRDLGQLTTAATHVPSWMADTILRIQQVKHGQLRHPA